MSGPVYLQYADRGLPGPARRPGYTYWMLGLWIVASLFAWITSLMAAADPSILNPPNLAAMPSASVPASAPAGQSAESDGLVADFSQGNDNANAAPAPTSATVANLPVAPTAPSIFVGVAMMFLGCTQFVAVVIAIVLQLMWIYRIHADAARARNYHEISPGLALGLSFIPLTSYVWTAYTLRRFARFDDRGRLAQGAPSTTLPRLTLWLLLAGFVITLLTTVQTINYLSIVFQGIPAAFQATGPGPGMVAPPTPDPTMIQIGVVLNSLMLAAVFLYMRVVVRTEKAIYG